MPNSRWYSQGQITGISQLKAGRTLVVAAFTRRLKLGDEERTAHLSFSVRPACVLMLDQTSIGRRARHVCDLRNKRSSVKWEASGPRRRSAGGSQRPAYLCCALSDEYRMLLLVTGCDALAALVLISVLCQLSLKEFRQDSNLCHLNRTKADSVIEAFIHSYSRTTAIDNQWRPGEQLHEYSPTCYCTTSIA